MVTFFHVVFSINGDISGNSFICQRSSNERYLKNVYYVKEVSYNFHIFWILDITILR